MSSSTKNHKPTCAVITLPDPDNKPVAYHAEEGGKLEIRSDAVNYPTFDVKIDGEHPFTKRQLSGSTTKPVVIPIPQDSEGDYSLTVTHHPPKTKSGKDVIQTFDFNVHPCKGCP